VTLLAFIRDYAKDPDWRPKMPEMPRICASMEAEVDHGIPSSTEAESREPEKSKEHLQLLPRGKGRTEAAKAAKLAEGVTKSHGDHRCYRKGRIIDTASTQLC
jgi:hypothetical protein